MTEKPMPLSVQVEISLGELIDKLTILEIKAERISDIVKRAHVQSEYAALLAVFDTNVAQPDTLKELHSALREVNRRLWDIEDEIRDYERRKDFGSSFIELARSVYLTNDRRAEIKRAINELLNSALIEEKCYRVY